MAQAKQVTQFNNFTAGLITEATELTFPPNSSYDEDNCVLSVKGNRKRRLGFDFEDDYTLSSFSATDTELETFAIYTYNWTAVGGDGDKNFLVVQLGHYLYFFDNAEDPLSGGEHASTVNLNSYLAPDSTTAEEDRVSCAVGRGDLFVVSPSIEPLQITYDVDSDTISAAEVDINVRDFDGIDDSLDVDDEQVSLSNEHHYNLLNQGWFPTPEGMDPLSVFYTEASTYPANNLQWFQAKKVAGARKSSGTTATWSNSQTGEPDTIALRRLSIGTTKAPRGHYIIDPFYKDRSSVSGVSSLDVESETRRPEAVCFYAGRVAYGLKSSLYISQVLTQDRDNAGKCYQEADPTSEDISDLVDSDGVVIDIPEAGNIRAIAAVGPSLIVFANNGVWYISGASDSGFKATDFSVTKLTSLGILSRHGLINVEGLTVWFNETSIMGLQIDGVTGRPSAVSLSDEKVKTFYTDIDVTAKANALGEYDVATKTVQFLYKDDDAAEDSSSPYFYNKMLMLDTRLGAFYKYSISNIDTETPYIAGVFRTPSLNTAQEVLVVLSGTDTVLSSTDSVIADIPVTVGISTFVKYLCIVPNAASTANNITFGLFQNLSFTDWEKYDILNNDGSGADFESYLETGFDLQGDMVRQKQAPFIITHCKRTETGYIINDDDEPEFINPSSLYLQARWDWTDNGNYGKWGSNQQVYRIQRNFIPDESELTYDPGNLVVTARSKIRGSGRALQLRFESESGKDFDLLGWGIVYTGNTDV
jgi:hypothetical protein